MSVACVHPSVMSISHMPRGAATSIMQGLPHHLQNSMAPLNVGGNMSGGGGLFTGMTEHHSLDDPNPDMLLALLARNKALEGESRLYFLLVIFAIICGIFHHICLSYVR